MTKKEYDVVVPIKPTVYKRFVDDVFSKRKRIEPDNLLKNLNKYHKNIKFAVEINPSKFLRH